jgi:hypothetical protein
LGLCFLNPAGSHAVSKIYARPVFSIGIEQRSIAMAELYCRDEPKVWPTPPTVRPGDPSFIKAANIVAGWVYQIAGPFF